MDSFTTNNIRRLVTALAYDSWASLPDSLSILSLAELAVNDKMPPRLCDMLGLKPAELAGIWPIRWSLTTRGVRGWLALNAVSYDVSSDLVDRSIAFLYIGAKHVAETETESCNEGEHFVARCEATAVAGTSLVWTNVRQIVHDAQAEVQSRISDRRLVSLALVDSVLWNVFRRGSRIKDGIIFGLPKDVINEIGGPGLWHVVERKHDLEAAAIQTLAIQCEADAMRKSIIETRNALIDTLIRVGALRPVSDAVMKELKLPTIQLVPSRIEAAAKGLLVVAPELDFKQARAVVERIETLAPKAEASL
ncbi:MAG: hypothetical protein ABL901_10050 [Hyphomicrobiaceae bacterium]